MNPKSEMKSKNDFLINKKDNKKMPKGQFTSRKESDNYITCEKGWTDLIPFIPKGKKIWSPFYCDGKQKEIFKKHGIDIIHEDKDFFEYEPEEWDIIIDNPPFSIKKEVLKRIKSFNKPWIMICPSMMLSYKYFQEDFKDKIQVIIPQKRITFQNLDSDKKNYTPPFASFYFCYDVGLEKDMIFI